MTTTIYCAGAGPHAPADGNLGETDQDQISPSLCAPCGMQVLPPDDSTATAQVTVDTHAVDAAMVRAEKATTVAGLRAAVVDLARAIGTD